MNLLDVTNKLQTEDQCLDFIEKVRWPDGAIRCVKCDSERISRITRTVDATKKNKRTRLYACLECNHRFTPTVGTLFHDSHLPLTKWFMAVALIVHAKKGMSALQMQRHLGVNYRTAWYMGHRIRKAMAEGNIVQPARGEGSGGRGQKFSGTVEVDETYIGGKKKGNKGKYKSKAVVMGIRERGGDLRLIHVEDNVIETLSREIKEHVDPKVERIITDEWSGYPSAMIAAGIHGSKHATILHKDHNYVVGDIYTNTVESAFSLFKRGIVGSFHRVSHKHLHRYLSEFEYRFNGRKMPNLLGATVAHMVGTKEMKYRELITN